MDVCSMVSCSGGVVSLPCRASVSSRNQVSWCSTVHFPATTLWGVASFPYCFKSDCRTTGIRVAKFGTGSFLLFAPELVQNGAAGGVLWSDGRARSYIEDTNPVSKFLNKVRGALPVVGLISRLMSPEGGVGSDRVRFEEFCTRIGRKCNSEDTAAFYEYQDRHGKTAKVPFVLIWCWAAAMGAGLLRSDDLLMSASRLRASFDIEFEVENLDLLMDDATKKREKSGSTAPIVPMEVRAEKALEAICKCCTGRTTIAEEDVPLLSRILKVVFPTANRESIDLAVASRLFDPYTTSSNSVTIQGVDEPEKMDELSQINYTGNGKKDDHEIAETVI